MKECIVVLGMHRSGTSVLAGMVSLQGYYLGVSEMPKREDNPKGFYENFKVYQLNQSILLDHNTSWDEYSFSLGKITPADLHRYEEKARQIIKDEFGLAKRIFLKDPRMCLLFPMWEKVLSEMGYNIKVILVYRSPMEVAHSLKSRNDMAVEKSLMMWSHHFFQAEKSSRSFTRMLVRYDDDIQDVDAFFKTLSYFLGIELNDEMVASANELYSPKLKHHQLNMDNLSDDVPSYLKEFISILVNDNLDDTKQLDSIVNEFYNSQNFYLFNEENRNQKISNLEEELVEVKRQLEAAEYNIDQQEIRIGNAKDDYQTLLKEFGAVKGSLEGSIKYKNIEIEDTKDKLIEANEKLIVGEELFRKALINKSWNKKLTRTVKGSQYFKYKRVLIPFSKPRNKQFLTGKIAIIESGLFSPFYYLTKNPDVWRAGVEPLNHFLKHGWKEGRNPSQYFDCANYLKENKDVAKSAKNPLLHYIQYGKKEGRSPGVSAEPPSENEFQNEVFNVTDANCVALKKQIANRELPEVVDSNGELLVSILVLTRDGLEHLKVLIPALFENTKEINYELIVVDNNSKDDSISYLENCGYDIDITVIKNASNETFSKANNRAAERAKGKYLVLLNNDVEPMRGWLHSLLHAEQTNEKIGSVGSRLVYPFKKSFKNSCTIQHAGIAFRDEVSFFRPYNQANGALIDSSTVKKSGARSAVTAACLLVRADIYQEMGGLDEGYNYGFEDVDFGLKLIEAGYINHYCADSMLLHYEFGTQSKNNRNEVIKRREDNANLLREKWSATIKQNYWKEKLFDGSHLFAEKPMKVAIAVTDYGPNVTAGDYFTAQEIASYLEEFGWSINYLSRVKGEWYQLDDDVDVLISLLDAYDLSELPERNTRLYTIAWARNWFDRWCQMSCFNDYDMVFASSNKSCDYVREHSQQEPMLLPIASNLKRFIQKPECNNSEFYESDICFTGSYWDSPRDIMQALSEKALEKYRFNVYGANWEKFDKFKTYSKGFVAYEDMPCVYHHTKIAIDDANHVTKPYGAVNSRVFDALMSGALVITNGIEGSKDLFDGELPYYETPQQLDDLLDLYLNDDKAREDKVQKLKTMIIKDHTYKHRAQSIREALERRFLSQSIAIKIPAPTWEGAHSWGDYHMAVLLKQQLENLGYYVLLQILPEWDNEEGMECDVVIVLRGLSRYSVKSHQMNIMWNISHPDKVTLEEYEEYDKVFIASELWADKIAAQVSVPVEAMLQCTDPERFHEPSETEKAQNQQQLLFVGNSRDVYRKVLKDLLPTDYDLAVYGKKWNKLIPRKYIKGDHIANDELYLHYGSADVLLNDHWDDMREQGFVSNRIFDGLACGAFILTDQVKAMGELKGYVQVYETPEELRTHLEFYLGNPEERCERAKKGMKFVVENHTFKARAKVFSDSIKMVEKHSLNLKVITE